MGEIDPQRAVLTLLSGEDFEDYYSAIPDDPKPERARELLKEITSLCERVMKREKRKMSKKERD